MLNTYDPLLAHKAEAVAVVERIAGKAAQYNVIIYTRSRPDRKNKDQGTEIKIGKYNFMPTCPNDAKDGFVKIIARPTAGVHILDNLGIDRRMRPVAGIQPIHAHPTLAEVIKKATHAASSSHKSIPVFLTPMNHPEIFFGRKAKPPCRYFPPKTMSRCC